MEMEPRCCDFYPDFHATLGNGGRKADVHADIL